MGLLILTLFTTALVLWTYSWWIGEQPESLAAFWCSAAFWMAGILVLGAWRVTYG